jgi:type I restriction enzyme S subunit
MTINRYILSSEFCESVRDGTHDTPKRTNSGYRLVTSKHIKNGQINSDEGYFISVEDFNKINERSLVEQWDVLMSMIGTIGEAAIVKDQPKYAIKNVALFKCGDELKAKWLYYFLCSPEGKGQLFSNQKGASQQFISLTQLRNLQIPIRDQSTMKKITDILSAYDDLIENNQKQIMLLEEAAMRLYKEWFVNLRFPGHEKSTIENSIPEDWKIVQLGEISDFKYGKMPKKDKIKDTGYPIFSGYGIVGYYDEFMFENEMLILVARGVGGTGDVKLSPCRCYLTNLSIAFLLHEEKHKYFLYQQYQYKNLRELDTGAAQSQITIENLKRHKTILPSIKIIGDFNRFFQPLHDKVLLLTEQINMLQAARDKLLPKLMSGEIEV